MADILAQSLGHLEATAPALSWGRQMAREARRQQLYRCRAPLMSRDPTQPNSAARVLSHLKKTHAPKGKTFN